MAEADLPIYTLSYPGKVSASRAHNWWPRSPRSVILVWAVSLSCAEAGGTELHAHRKPSPAPFPGAESGPAAQLRLPTAGEAAGPRSVLALLSGGTVAQDQVGETAGLPLSIVYSLLS